MYAILNALPQEAQGHGGGKGEETWHYRKYKYLTLPEVQGSQTVQVLQDHISPLREMCFLRGNISINTQTFLSFNKLK